MAKNGIQGTTNSSELGYTRNADAPAAQRTTEYNIGGEMIGDFGAPAAKSVTDEVINQVMSETNDFKRVDLLLDNSPIGRGQQPSREDIENMGFSFHLTTMHLGAPMEYKSSDGATITVYDGRGTQEAGENERKTIYRTDRYTQEMYYDNNGNLTKSKIIIKDNVTGFKELDYDILWKPDGKMMIIK